MGLVAKGKGHCGGGGGGGTKTNSIQLAKALQWIISGYQGRCRIYMCVCVCVYLSI